MPVSNETLIEALERNNVVLTNTLSAVESLGTALVSEVSSRKRHIRWLSVVVVFDILLSCAFIGIAWRLHYDEQDARVLRCNQANSEKLAVRQSFDALINLVEKEYITVGNGSDKSVEDLRVELHNDLDRLQPVQQC